MNAIHEAILTAMSAPASREAMAGEGQSAEGLDWHTSDACSSAQSIKTAGVQDGPPPLPAWTPPDAQHHVAVSATTVSAWDSHRSSGGSASTLPRPPLSDQLR